MEVGRTARCDPGTSDPTRGAVRIVDDERWGVLGCLDTVERNILAPVALIALEPHRGVAAALVDVTVCDVGDPR